MGVEYISVNSAARAEHETTSRIHVELQKPIQKATSVQVVGFSTANEFYNIQNGNNTLTILVYQIGVQMFSFTIELEPGFYTGEEMINEINRQLTVHGQGVSAANPGVGLVTIQFELLANLRTQISMSAGSTPMKRVVLYVPSEQVSKDSLAKRLGFTKDQVSWTNTPDLFRLNNGVVEMLNRSGRYLYYIPETEIDNCLIFQPGNTSNRVFKGSHISFETHPYIYIESDLSSSVRSCFNRDDVKIVHSVPVLQRVDINVNRHSWVAYASNFDNLVHPLDGKTISNFYVQITNPDHQPFLIHESKDYVVLLKFETHDDNDDVNERVIRNIQRQDFLKRHGAI